MEKLNQEWFLPYTQRPYVWGSRYESETYICRLFDSLLREYPIGTLLVWNTDKEVPFREFVADYNDENSSAQFVDEGRWGQRNKGLIYDGQQRLQTLYSCLKHRLNKKVLVFDLLFDLKKEVEPKQTGFAFVEKNEELQPSQVRMTEVFSKTSGVPSQKEFQKEILQKSEGRFTEEEIDLVDENVTRLWKVFVDKDKKSLAYYQINQDNEQMVNEIFQRINTGGISLSQADLLLSKIKEIDNEFEERLQLFTKSIYSHTGNGYRFEAYSSLQLIHLAVQRTIRVDPDKIKRRQDLKSFVQVWDEMQKPLRDFFESFLYGAFKINRNEVIPKENALYPLALYLYHKHKKGTSFKKLDNSNLLRMKQYLILSQVNDWNTQGIIDEFSRLMKDAVENSGDFPLAELKSYAVTKKRGSELREKDFVGYRWFSLKILTPGRLFQFDPDSSGRFNPEIDHIFPAHPKGKEKDGKYFDRVNIVWNMQPVPGEVNNYKRRKDPQEFFLSEEGKKYIVYYDHLPTKDLHQPVWTHPHEFIEKRRRIMIDYLKTEYELELK